MNKVNDNLTFCVRFVNKDSTDGEHRVMGTLGRRFLILIQSYFYDVYEYVGKAYIS